MKRINQLIKDIERHPFEGIGKPEPLKGNLTGLWSRRIDEEHRIVYLVEGEWAVLSNIDVEEITCIEREKEMENMARTSRFLFNKLCPVLLAFIYLSLKIFAVFFKSVSFILFISFAILASNSSGILIIPPFYEL